jgi:hypothetical protein
MCGLQAKMQKQGRQHSRPGKWGWARMGSRKDGRQKVRRHMQALCCLQALTQQRRCTFNNKCDIIHHTNVMIIATVMIIITVMILIILR